MLDYIRRTRRRRRRMAEQRIVLALKQHGGQYGYDLEKLTGMRPGRVYPSLRRLMDAGFISDEWVEQDNGLPMRRRYALTDQQLIQREGK